MNRRNLIYYSSFTGNTELVAKAIGEVFDKEGWETDFMKVGKGFDSKHHDIDFLSYDFLCVGSPVLWHVPFDPLLWGIRTVSHRVEYVRMETGPKCGLAFTTYGGAHFGEHEADAALILLELAYEHLGFKSVAKIAVPGKVSHRGMKDWYFPDMQTRPNEEDLDYVRTITMAAIAEVNRSQVH